MDEDTGVRLEVFEILIPRTDGRSGVVHAPEMLDEWVLETAERFGGITVLGCDIFGLWFDDGSAVRDHSNWYKVGVDEADAEALRQHVRETALRFGQKCLYFEHCGSAELVPGVESQGGRSRG